MANIDIEQRPKANILPWLVGLAILVVVVGWLLWRNNRIPDVQGRLETPARNDALDEAHAEALPIASEPLVDRAVEPDTREPA
ncbi:MAG: hypothetical protein V4850_00325 [Myxococcota bacterium]